MKKMRGLAGMCLAYLALIVTGIAQSGEKPEIYVQMGHTKSLTCALFSPDGKYLLSGSADHTIKVWDIETGRELQTLRGPTDRITSMAISPDGKSVISGDEEFVNNLKLWDLSTGQIRRAFGGHQSTEGTTCVAFTPDGRFVVSGGDTTVRLWDIASGKEVRRFLGNHDDVRTIVISPDGKYVASGSRSNSVSMIDSLNPDGSVYESQQVRAKSTRNTILVWEIASAKMVRSFNYAHGWVQTLSMSPDGKYLFSGDFEDNVRMWEFASGRQLKSFETNGTSSLAISPDGNYALFGGVSSIALWNIKARALVGTIEGLDGWVRTVAFSPDAGYARALTADDRKSPGLWDLASGKQVMQFGGNTQRVSRVVMSPDGKKLLVGQGYGFINIWDVASGRQTGTIKNTLGMESLAIDEGGTTVGAGGWDFPAHASTAKFWDLTTGKELCTTTNDGFSWVRNMTINPGLRQSLWTAGGKLFLSDVKTGKTLRTYEQSDGELDFSTMNADGKYAVVGDPVKVNILELATGNIVKTYSAEGGAMRFGSNGKTVLVIKSNNDLTSTWQIWDFASGKEIVNRSVRFYLGFGPTGLSPDGRFALFNNNLTISLWDIAKGKEIRSFSGHTNTITAFGMSPDQTFLYTGSEDGTTRFWDVGTGKEIARFVAFTNGEWIVITPQGYFSASPNGAKYLNVRIGANFYSIDNFYEKFYSPSYVASVLKGKRQESVADMRRGITLPPQVTITSPKPGTEFKSDALTLTLSAKDMGGGVDEVRLYQNGKVVSEEQRGMKSVGTSVETVSKSYQVTLLPGLNTFRAVALNRERTESNPDEITVELKAAEASSDLYLFVVGINEYKNGKYNLNYGKSDATAFGNAVAAKSKTIFRNVHLYQLFDGQALRPGMEAMFRTIAATAKAQDAFVFYYAGHGVMSEGSDQAPSDFYLIPSDVTKLYGNDAMLVAKAISAAQLKTFCTTIKAQKQLVVLDACQSGGAIESFATRGASEERAIMQLARSAGTVLLASTSTEQFATEFSTLSHGVFTYALLQGLNGEADGGNPKDGKITVKELEAYLNDRVPELTKKYRGTAQYPNSYARGQDFPLGVK